MLCSARSASPPPFGLPGAVAHSPIMMPENARTRAATSAEVTTERTSESGRWGSGVGDTGRQVPRDTSDHADSPRADQKSPPWSAQKLPAPLVPETCPPSFQRTRGRKQGGPGLTASNSSFGVGDTCNRSKHKSLDCTMTGCGREVSQQQLTEGTQGPSRQRAQCDPADCVRSNTLRPNHFLEHRPAPRWHRPH